MSAINIIAATTCVIAFLAPSVHSSMVACTEDNEGFATSISFCFLWHCKGGNKDAWPIVEQSQYPMCTLSETSIDRNDNAGKCNLNGKGNYGTINSLVGSSKL